MASLVGQQLKDTYDSLLKTSDNDALSGTYKEITDGSGNGSNLFLGTGGNVGIGISPDTKLHVFSTSAAPAKIITSSVTNSSLLIGNTSTGVAILNLDGSNGDAAGADYFSIVQNNDLTANIYTQANAGVLTLGSKGTLNAMTIDGGNVGIGTTSPVGELNVNGRIVIDDNAVSNPTGGASLVLDYQTTSDVQGRIRSRDWDAGVWKNLTAECNEFIVSAGGSEKVRIDSSGNLLVGTTTTKGHLTISGDDDLVQANVGIQSQSASASTHYMISFFKSDGSTVGYISHNDTATAYNTSSDYRLKENIVELDGALNKVLQLKPSKFNFKSDTDSTVSGFIAHEVQEVVPEAVTGEKDAVDEEGNPMYQGIDHSKLVPILVGAIQELKAEIEQLKAQ